MGYSYIQIKAKPKSIDVMLSVRHLGLMIFWVLKSMSSSTSLCSYIACIIDSGQFHFIAFGVPSDCPMSPKFWSLYCN